MAEYEYTVKIPVLASVTAIVVSDRELTEDELWEQVKDRDDTYAPWEGDSDWTFEPVRSVGGGNVYYGEVHDFEVSDVYIDEDPEDDDDD